MLKIDLNLTAVNQRLDGITKAVKEDLQPAAQAGAQVFYDLAKSLAPVSKAPHKFHIGGRVYGPFKPGTLRDSIYQVYAKTKSSDSRVTYEISFNHTKAPYGFAVLRGTPKAPAKDFIGQAYDIGESAAKLVTKTRLEQSVKKRERSS